MTTTPISDEKILTAAKSLPVAPQIMARLHKMLLDSNSGLPEIATLLKRDVSLTNGKQCPKRRRHFLARA